MINYTLIMNIGLKSILLIILLFETLCTYAQIDSSIIEYRPELFDFDGSKPTFKLTEEQIVNSNRFLRFSMLTGYRDGVESISGQFGSNFLKDIDSIAGTHRIYMLNLSIQDILTHGFFKSNRVLLEVKDPYKYRYDAKYGSKLQWMRKNAYCYELLLPLGTMKGVRAVDQDLASIFKVACGRQRRLVNVWVLKRISKKDKLKAPGGEIVIDELSGRFANVGLSDVVQVVSNQAPFPVIDESGYAGTVDMNLNIVSWNDIVQLRKAFQRYDLDILEEKREIEMFVIKEINNGN